MKAKGKKVKERKLIFDEEGLLAFSVQLKKVRIQCDYTQSQLAFEAGLSLSQIARIETAHTNPTLSTIFVIARTLQVPLTDLFNFSLTEK